MEEICGCNPYGASTIAGADVNRLPSDNELARRNQEEAGHFAALMGENGIDPFQECIHCLTRGTTLLGQASDTLRVMNCL